MDTSHDVWIDYTNWRGERAVRRIRPTDLYFGVNLYHHEQQWLLRAYDVDKGAMRVFALKDIHRWSDKPLNDLLEGAPAQREQGPSYQPEPKPRAEQPKAEQEHE